MHFEHPALLTNEPTISDEEFSLLLSLIENAPTPLTDGLTQWKQIYEIAKECGDGNGMARGIQSILSVLGANGRAVEGLICARRMLTVAYEIGDLLIAGHALNAIASMHWMMGDHIAAFDACKRALAFARELPPKPMIHSFLGPEAIRERATDLLFTLRHSRGQLRRAIADHAAMLDIHRRSGNSLQVVGSMESLGLVYKDLGENAEALKWFSEALQEVQTVDSSDPRVQALVRAGILGNLGVLLTTEGDAEEALKCIGQSEDIYTALSDVFGQIAVYGQKGRALLYAGSVSEALDSFEKMLRLALQYDASSWQNAAHYNLARAWLASGDRLRAAVYCDHATLVAEEKLGHAGVDMNWLRASLFHPQVPVQQANADDARFVSLAYYAFYELHQAVRGARPSVVVAKWIDDFEDVIQVALQLPPNEPLRCPAIQLASAGTVAEGAALNRLQVLIQKSPFAGLLPLEIGLYCLESLRAQEFQEKLLLNSAELDLTHDSQLALELSRVEAELKHLQSAPPIVVTGAVSFDENHRLVIKDSASAESIAEQELTQQDYHRRMAELSALRSEIAIQTIESEQAIGTKLREPARLEEIRDALHEDEMFIEFVLLGQKDGSKRATSDVLLIPSRIRPENAFAIVITRKYMDVVPLGKTSAIESQCGKLLDMLERYGSELSLWFFQVEARRAFDLVLRPIWERTGEAMGGVRHLVISSDGALNLLPFDMLVDQPREAESWCDFDYLANRFSTEYCPSATVFVDLRQGRYQRGESGSLFVGFGDPTYRGDDRLALPGTRREVESIASIVRSAKPASNARDIRVFVGADAQKNALCNPHLLREAEYIHLACHGTAGRSPHLDGALFLAGEDDASLSDGVLRTREVMDLRTCAKLVTMSACESGLGQVTRGEGIQGMARAWLFAGAQSVIATMWQVEDDSAAEMMNAVYAEMISSSTSIVDALTAAKRKAIRERHLASPACWAAFIVFGGRSERAQRSRRVAPVRQTPESYDRPQIRMATASLDSEGLRMLDECGRTWEAAWRHVSDDRFRAFFDAAEKLALLTNSSSGAEYVYPANVTFGLVARNSKAAWEHWAKQGKAALAIRGYEVYMKWNPSARSEDWDVMSSAYRPENVKRVRMLARANVLPRECEISMNESADTCTVTTTIGWIVNESRAEGPIEIAVPINDDPGFTSTVPPIAYCRELQWAVFRLRPGDRISITERLTNFVHPLEDDSFVLGGTFGSSLFPHSVTIRFQQDYIPLRLQRQQIGRAYSIATVRFSEDGATVFLRPQKRAWRERFAVMFRRASGSSAMFGAPGSPFTEEIEFARFERLMRQAQQNR